MSRLRSYAPMNKVRQTKPPFQVIRDQAGEALAAVRGEIERLDPEVYRIVDRRSEGFCEVALDGVRCRKVGVDHHHTVKPRSTHHSPELVMKICREHHNRVDWPYKRGRLVTRANRDGTFACAIVTSPDKFTYQRGYPG